MPRLGFRPRVSRRALVSAGLTLLSLAGGAAAILLSEFGGAPAWLLGLLLGWLCTGGLPTLVSVLVLASVWPGPSLLAFVTAAGFLSWLAQHGALGFVSRARPRRAAGVRP